MGKGDENPIAGQRNDRRVGSVAVAAWCYVFDSPFLFYKEVMIMYKSFQDIPAHTQIYYHITVDWRDLKHVIDRYLTEDNLQLNPDFQRGHVWTEAQKIAFIEYILQGGTSGKHIYFNHPGWMSTFKGDFVLVDGLQRITAVLDFLDNKIKVFGKYQKDYEGYIPSDAHFDFNIARIQKRSDVLKWYIFMNIGGTPHTSKEIEKVKNLLALEFCKEIE